MTKRLILCLALIIGGWVSPASAQPAYDTWYQASCNPQGGAALWYNIPSWAQGTRVTYWRYWEGYVHVDEPFLGEYARTGYECGWMGQATHNAHIHTICEFGYCGTGIEQYFQNSRMLRHFAGPAAGWVQVYPR